MLFGQFLKGNKICAWKGGGGSFLGGKKLLLGRDVKMKLIGLIPLKMYPFS